MINAIIYRQCANVHTTQSSGLASAAGAATSASTARISACSIDCATAGSSVRCAHTCVSSMHPASWYSVQRAPNESAARIGGATARRRAAAAGVSPVEEAADLCVGASVSECVHAFK